MPNAELESLAEHAYQLLLTRILDGRLEPGAGLSVPALARVLDMGRSPVREAVQRLSYEGLAENVLHRGAVVTRLEPAELPDIYEAKEPLEGIAARRAAVRIRESDVAVLTQMIARQHNVLENDHLASSMMRLDVEFHRYIAELSGNAALAEVLGQFTTRTHLVVPSAWSNPDYARLSVDEHRRIAEALIRGDADEAEAAARRHIRNVSARLTRWLAR